MSGGPDRDDQVMILLAAALADGMNVGDTVSFFSVDGDVRVVFEGSPFTGIADVIRTGEIRLLTRPGIFHSKCFIALPSGTEIGWHPGESPVSGGEHDVRP